MATVHFGLKRGVIRYGIEADRTNFTRRASTLEIMIVFRNPRPRAVYKRVVKPSEGRFDRLD